MARGSGERARGCSLSFPGPQDHPTGGTGLEGGTHSQPWSPLTALPGHCWRDTSSEHQRWTLTLHVLHRKACLEFPGKNLGSTRTVRQRRIHPGARSRGGRLGHQREEGASHPRVSLGSSCLPLIHSRHQPKPELLVNAATLGTCPPQGCSLIHPG